MLEILNSVKLNSIKFDSFVDLESFLYVQKQLPGGVLKNFAKSTGNHRQLYLKRDSDTDVLL